MIEQQLVGRIADAMLYSRAKKDAGEKIDDELDKVVTAEIRRFVMDFGGDYAKAEQSLKQMGMDWGKFEQYQRRRILSQSYISQQMPKDQPITYSEMMTAYNETKGAVVLRRREYCSFVLSTLSRRRCGILTRTGLGRSRPESLPKSIVKRDKTGRGF